MICWRYDVGSFHSPSDGVLVTSMPVGTFSTGQHGILGKHQRGLGPRYSVRQVFADTPTRRRKALERGLAASR